MRDVTPADIDNKLDFIADFVPFLPPIFSDAYTYLPKVTLERPLSELDKMAMATASDKSYKILFWRKLRECEKLGIQMLDTEARCGVLSTVSLQKFADISNMLAWLLSPDMPADVSAEVKLHELGKKLEVLTKYSADGGDIPEDINYKFLDMQMKMFAMLDKRVNGDFLQKIEEKSMRINHNTNVTTKAPTPKTLSLEDKVKELQARLTHAQDLGGSGNQVVRIEGEKK
jgi:hypothetical protein